MIVKIVNGLSVSAHNKYGLQSLQLNIDTIKVEHETHLHQHAVDTLNEGDAANNKRNLSLSPVCPFIKCETEVSCMPCSILYTMYVFTIDSTVISGGLILILQVITDSIKSEPNSYCETYASPSHNENDTTGAKEEEDPLLLTFPLTQTENEVSYMSLLVP